MKKSAKLLVLTLVTGTLFQFGGLGCLGRYIPTLITSAALEFIWDNDGVLDLFEDGATAAADAG